MKDCSEQEQLKKCETVNAGLDSVLSKHRLSAHGQKLIAQHTVSSEAS